MSVKHLQLQEAIFDLEAALRSVGKWDGEMLDKSCFKSTMPFYVDTMEFYQWLQFVLIPRLDMIIQNQDSLALNASILPMAETSFPADEWHKGVFNAIEKIDILLRTPSNIH